MINKRVFSVIAVAGISALADSSYATQPPCATSDGNFNTACGTNSLPSNTGVFNTGQGYAALYANTSGGYNTASGGFALLSNTSGYYNTSNGFYALGTNTTGSYNTANGSYALFFNSTGSNLTAVGVKALYNNTTAINNTAVGTLALFSNTTGPYGTAVGFEALYNSQSGLANIGVGPFAGRNIVQGQLNIDIGSWGSADESNTIRIGLTSYHHITYIAGIYNTTGLSGLPVMVTPSGQLGVVASSERFKTDIATMSTSSEKLQQLHPVTFHYKNDAERRLSYGLIAEEVAKVYPELVIRDETGRIDGVRYDELAPMLLNEVQKEQVIIAAQAQHAASQDAEIRDLRQQLARVHELELRLDAVLQQHSEKGDPVASR